ncbi:solute carrier family 20 [Babesia microti strain RI]|uniref:Phosphate transporter n=1 Tax=Babesia microti (strain RI) TaxID=1133968 RepID=A0A1N6LWH9_BABMR|nr:solute carrier family 20 [Babesia microti strain RI]SIO73216.1 solute carrier family 20 [Babesia microti strain RI]|eukprot:XP_021337324.1 solute carrier family 20 [Babesia microti strain RI]
MEFTLTVTCIVVSILVGVAIGANDVANSFSTSVGSGAMTLNAAIIAAFIFELLGAVLLGASVTDSIKVNIIDLKAFESCPRILATGMLSSSISIFIWLSCATFAGLPVSTTHSIIGSLIGFGIASGNAYDLNWRYLSLVFVTWLLVPIGTIIISCSAYIMMLWLIDKYSQHLYKFIIIFCAISCLPVSLFLAFKHPFKVGKKEVSSFIYFINEYKFAVFVIVYTTLILTATIFSAILVRRRCKFGYNPQPNPFFDNNGKFATGTENNDQQTDALSKPEIIFSSVQVIAAVMNIISHASNDAANAAMPISVILTICFDLFDSKFNDWYILLCSGASMSIGLAAFGKYVMKTVGFKLTRVTPSRGYTIDSVSSSIVLSLSYIGMPISSTHCVVSATLGVGMVIPNKPEAEPENAESEPQNAESGPQNAESGPQNAESEPQNAESEPQNAESEPQNNILCIFGVNKRLSFERVNLFMYRRIFIAWIATIIVSALTSAGTFLSLKYIIKRTYGNISIDIS